VAVIMDDHAGKMHAGRKWETIYFIEVALYLYSAFF